MKSRLIALGIAFFLLGVPAAAADRIKIVASFSVLGDMVQQIAGNHADLVTLVGPNGDAHTYEPSPTDAKSVAAAKIIFVNGLGLDKWMERLAKSSDTKGTVVVTSKGVKPRTMVEESETITDPHAWQDIENGVLYVQNISATLSSADPVNAADYRAASDAYIVKLHALDADIRRQIAAVPPGKRRVITSHDAFGYFGAAYGVEFLAPEGLSTETEASAGDLSKLMDQIKQEHIKALFLENMTDPRMMTMLSSETGVELGGDLYSDALSPADGPAAHYIDMFKNNVAKLVAGMQKN